MKPDTPMHAIRLRCLDCCAFQANEVKLCTADDCPLYAYRSGHRPTGKKRKLSPEQKEIIKNRFADYRKKKSIANAKN